MREVHRIAIQLISDAQVRGELKEKCVNRVFPGLIASNCSIRSSWLAYLTVDEIGDLVLHSANPSETVKIRRGCRILLH